MALDRTQLLRILGGSEPPAVAAAWLRGTYLPYLIARFNSDDVRKRLGLYQHERIPANERNLTDVRNRVSLIVEYELARISNDIVTESEIDDLFWSYVVANRFPDLEVRHRDGRRGLRVEVKCLQSIAEEKAANFDTLKKDLHPATDFVVVFVWEWACDAVQVAWDRAPRILAGYVFHARSLAELRDCYWLNQPPSNLGGGFQGFDLRYAVNCNAGTYAVEEGNYGKLMRIWKRGFPHRPSNSPELVDCEEEYLRFQPQVILSGFWNLAESKLPVLSACHAITRVTLGGAEVGAIAGEFGWFMKWQLGTSDIRILMRDHRLRYAVALTEKYACTGYRPDGTITFGPIKPKRLDRLLFGLV